MGVLVPDLRQKYRLLETYGLVSNLDVIAEKLNKSPKTLLWWADGSDVRPRDTVPNRSFDNLVVVFSGFLKTLTRDEVRQFLLGSAADLENYLLSDNTPSLMHFVRTEGDSTINRLIYRDDGGVGLIEISEPKPDDEGVYVVDAEQEFRIVVEQDLRFRHVLALQHAQGQWLPLKHSIHDMDGYCLIPHVDKNGTPLFMYERHDFGRHLFIVLVTEAPFPAQITALKEQSAILDVATLGKLASHYGNQPKTRRRIFTLAIDVRK